MAAAHARLYVRTFAVGAVWFIAVAVKMISLAPGPWTSYPAQNLIVLVVGWFVTALLLGVAATHFQGMRSWVATVVGTAAGSGVVLGLMLFIVQTFYTPSPPKFKSTDEMMVYLAIETTKWVKKDRGIDLDYSLESVKVVEEELGRIAKDVDRARPRSGTFGLALGYGAYIGEVFRRRDGGSWGVDHPEGGRGSYPFSRGTNGVIFPVGWCWRRLINGEEDNVFHKAMLCADIASVITNNTAAIKR